ncbi:autotransporter adhesin family protein [Aliarcobacter cryaerophilus]|uniref:beta strand repeat-containing protein n=1 Tax=Aliarcobacter cryaerophilus TaxID=28198 RepID=UPI003DA35C16
MKGATGGLELGFTTAAVAGTDTVKVTLDGTTSGDLKVNGAVENVVLTTKNSAATLTGFTAAATTVTIKGGQGFKLDAPAAKIFTTATTIDAREAGKAEFTAAAATTLLTGSADDKITITKNFAAGDLFNLGAGNDTLVVDVVSAATNQATFVGVENVTFKKAGSAINMAKADQKAALTFEDGGAITATELAAGSTVTNTKAATAVGAVTVEFRDSVMGEKSTIDLQKGATSVTVKNIKDATINYGADSTGAITLDDNTAAVGTVATSEVTTALTVNAKAGAITGAAITGSTKLTDLTVNVSKGATAAGITLAKANELTNLTVNAADATSIGDIGSGTAGAGVGTAGNSTKLNNVDINATGGNVTIASIHANNVNGISTISLDATGGTINAVAATPTVPATATAITNTGSIKDVVITGTKDVTVSLTSSNANVDKLVSTSTGNTDIKITNGGTANEAGSTVTLGNAATGKANTLEIIGGQKQSVIGGTGVDKVTVSGAGASTITLGAGDDTIKVGAGSINNITLGAGKDIVTFDISKKVGTADAATLAQKHTVITDFKGAATDGDIIHLVSSGAIQQNLSTVNLATTATTTNKLKGTADGFINDWGINSVTNLPNTSTTLEDKIKLIATEASFATTAGISVAFGHEGKTYLFIEGKGATGLDVEDTLIELTGISASTGITFAGNDITNIA